MFNLGPMWGIDIGDSAIKAVKLKRVGNEVVLLDFHIIRYSDLTGEPGTRRDGMISEALNALKAAGMKNDRCFVSIAPQAVFSRFISLPPVDKRRIPEIVLYEARQQIPFDLSDVIWAYQTVHKEFVIGEEIEIGLFAVKREVVEDYLLELAPIRQKLQGIQVGPLALYNFVRHEMPFDKPTVILDIGAQSTNLLIVAGEKFWLRNLPVAGNSFTSVLEKRLNIPRVEAEKLKCGVGESRHRRKLLEILRAPMRDLVAEVQRSIGYYNSLAQEVKFGNILVMGEGYSLFGLDRFLADQLQYKITPIHKLEHVPFQGFPEKVKALEQAMPCLGPAMGLALQGLGQSYDAINLLPDDFVIQRELWAKRFSGLIAAVLVWAVFGCFWLNDQRFRVEANSLREDSESQLSKVVVLDKKHKAAASKIDKKRLVKFKELGHYRGYYTRIIRTVSEILPKDNVFVPEKCTFEIEGERKIESDMAGRYYQVQEPLRAEKRDKKKKEVKIPKGSFVMTFGVIGVEVEESFFREDLPLILQRAAIFPERMPIVNNVHVDKIGLTSVKDAGEHGIVMRNAIKARVRLVLIKPQDLAQRRKQFLKKKAEEAEQKAEAERKAEAAAAADAITPADKAAKSP